MALRKISEETGVVRVFKEFKEAELVFKDKTKSIDERIKALSYILGHNEVYYVLKMLSKLFKVNRVEDHPLIDYAFANFSTKPKREEDFDEIFKILKSDNAYLRNMAVKFLQEFSVDKRFIEKLLESEDRDIRIFAIKILGSVKYDDSVDMLRDSILKEEDVNATVTAVEYLGEIGSEEDIRLLETVKEKYKDEPYLQFAVDITIDRLKG